MQRELRSDENEKEKQMKYGLKFTYIGYFEDTLFFDSKTDRDIKLASILRSESKSKLIGTFSNERKELDGIINLNNVLKIDCVEKE